jgi:hypothetical protein
MIFRQCSVLADTPLLALHAQSVAFSARCAELQPIIRSLFFYLCRSLRKDSQWTMVFLVLCLIYMHMCDVIRFLVRKQTIGAIRNRGLTVYLLALPLTQLWYISYFNANYVTSVIRNLAEKERLDPFLFSLTLNTSVFVQLTLCDGFVFSNLNFSRGW